MFEVFFDNNTNNYSSLLNSIVNSKLLKYFFSDLKFYYDDNYLVYFLPKKVDKKYEDYIIINLKKEDKKQYIFEKNLEILENNYINNTLQKYSYKNII